MIERIKSMPWGVKVSALFLLAVYVAMCVMVPMIGLILALIIGTWLSMLRIFHYLSVGD
jgi:hypothetical protein